MLAVFLLMGGVVIGAGIAGAYFAPSKSFFLRMAGTVAALSVMAAASVHFWKHVILAVAIASLVALAVGVMLQRANPVKAVYGALAAFVLLFVFSWLAVELADVFLFGNGSEVLAETESLIASFTQFIAKTWNSLFAYSVGLGAIDGVWIAIEDFLLELHPTLRFALVILAIVAFLRIVLSTDKGSTNRGEKT